MGDYQHRIWHSATAYTNTLLEDLSAHSCASQSHYTETSWTAVSDGLIAWNMTDLCLTILLADKIARLYRSSDIPFTLKPAKPLCVRWADCRDSEIGWTNHRGSARQELRCCWRPRCRRLTSGFVAWTCAVRNWLDVRMSRWLIFPAALRDPSPCKTSSCMLVKTQLIVNKTYHTWGLTHSVWKDASQSFLVLCTTKTNAKFLFFHGQRPN